MLLEKPAKEPDRGCLVPLFPGQDIQDQPILIDGSEQVLLLLVDPNKDFIDKPRIAAWTGPDRLRRLFAFSGPNRMHQRRTVS